jgi:phosphosulfolactate synthase
LSPEKSNIYDSSLDNGIWSGIINHPLPGRLKKPRSSGLTMMMDKGMSFNQLKDLLDNCSDYMDLIKFTHGTSTLLSEEVILQKIELIKNKQINVMPGGTLLETAMAQNVEHIFLKKAQELGFSTIEVSDATLPIDKEKKIATINMAKEMGFKVITEVGIKDPEAQISVERMAVQMKNELQLGIDFTIMDATEYGVSIGIYDSTGKVKIDLLDKILEIMGSDINRVMWEAPTKGQQAFLIRYFGNNVNLGNIQADEIIPVESLRRGLRTDTLKMVYVKQEGGFK